MVSFILLLFLITITYAADWAVIIAGSTGYWNYRHQASASAAYQSFIKKGIPKQNIITFMSVKDVWSEKNPFKGKLYNSPGVELENVFNDMSIEYGSAEITSNRILNVLSGNSFSSKRVLRSSFLDTVYVAIFNYGAPGVITLPKDAIFGNELQKTIDLMHKKRMYKELVFIVDGAGSDLLFSGMALNDYNIKLINPESQSIPNHNIFCPPDDMINYKNMGTCLNTQFSYEYWNKEKYALHPILSFNQPFSNDNINSELQNKYNKDWSVYDTRFAYYVQSLWKEPKSAELRRTIQDEDNTRNQIEQYFKAVSRDRKIGKNVISISEWDCYKRGVRKVEKLFFWNEYTFHFFKDIVSMCEQNKMSF